MGVRDRRVHSDPDRSRQGGHRIDELAKLVTSQVQALDGVSRTMSCPVVHL